MLNLEITYTKDMLTFWQEATKNSLRRQRPRKAGASDDAEPPAAVEPLKKKKRVSFG